MVLCHFAPRFKSRKILPDRVKITAPQRHTPVHIRTKCPPPPPRGDTPVATTLISDFVISDEKILNIIRSLNPNKAHGWDEISVRMIKMSDVALVSPFKIIVANCLRCGVFPAIWKCENVVPVHKKNEKNVKGNYPELPSYFSFTKFWENT